MPLRSITAQEARRLIENGATVVDVREPTNMRASV